MAKDIWGLYAIFIKEDGCVIDSVVCKIKGRNILIKVEDMAINKVMIAGYQRIEFESDNLNLIKMMNTKYHTLPRSLVTVLCKNMKRKCRVFRETKFHHIATTHKESTHWLDRVTTISGCNIGPENKTKRSK